MNYHQLKVCFLILFVFFGCLKLKSQGTDRYLMLETRADSLAKADRHKEAYPIYKSIIEDFNESLERQKRLILEYKLAFSLMHSGEDLQAMQYFRNVISGTREIASDTLVNDAMTGLGKTYEYTGKHDSAFYWYMAACKDISGSGDTVRIARDIRNLAQLLRVLKRYDEARIYCLKALNMIPGIRDFKVTANIYNETAYLFELSGDLDSAAFFYTKLIELSVENEYLKGESVGYSNLASVYERRGKMDGALELKLKGLEIDREINDNYGLMTSLSGLSSVYLMTGRHDEALETLDQAYKLCDTSWLPALSGIKYDYYRIYKSKGFIDKALASYEEHIILRDRINQAESRKQVAEILAKYETEEKINQIRLLEQANLLKESKIHTQWIIISTMIIIFLLMTLSGWLLIRNKSQKFKQIQEELQYYIMGQEQNDLGTDGHEVAKTPAELYIKWGLTARESEILFYLGNGHSNSEIAEKLFISGNTVKFHIKNIYLKLDVKTRIQALLRCRIDKSRAG